MIYFLLNNDYHRLDFELHAPSLVESGLHIIEVKHTLAAVDNSQWGRTSRFEPVLNSGVLRAWVSLWATARAIKRQVKPKQEDVLFLYTEFEPLNQLIVGLFRRAGAKVYLIEDGGIATYVTFRSAVSEALSIRELLMRSVYRLLSGAHKLRMQKIAGNVYPWMPDDSFDGLCLYRPVSIARAIQVVPLRRPAERKVENCKPERIVFLNQDLYAFSYMSGSEYMDILSVIMRGLASTFESVLFKFHPRETREWREKISKEVLSRWPNIVCLPERPNVEASLDQLRVCLAASFNSTALMNLAYRGVQPVFLYHLFPALTRHADFQQNTCVLTEWGYNFVSEISEVNSNYDSGLRDVQSSAEGRRSIKDIAENLL